MSRFLESPPFRWMLNTGDLLASGTYTPGSFENDPDKAPYMPFNTITVKNLSTQDIDLDYGQDRVTLIPGGTIITVSKGGIYTFKVTNLDTVNANDNRIEITLERALTVEYILLSRILGLRLCQVLDGLRGGGC